MGKLVTKLKNYRGLSWGVSTCLAVIASAVTSISISALLILYDIRYLEYFEPSGDGEEYGETWYSMGSKGG